MQAEAVTWMSLGQPSKALPLLEAALATQPNDGVMRSALGWSLMHTGQFERMAEEGQRFQKAIALNALNRPEEAMMIVQELADQGLIGGLLGQLDRAGKHRELIEFIESRWADLASFEREYPDAGDGYSSMLHIARAYSFRGNEARFEDAMARVRAAHDHALAQGLKDPYLLMHDARYYTLAGDPERAKQLLAQAVDSGILLGRRLDHVWGEMTVLSGDPEFEAIQARMDERMNSERTALGLEPISS
jgi:tetratricopeptide (TPR) repeat protein